MHVAGSPILKPSNMGTKKLNGRSFRRRDNTVQKGKTITVSIINVNHVMQFWMNARVPIRKSAMRSEGRVGFPIPDIFSADPGTRKFCFDDPGPGN